MKAQDSHSQRMVVMDSPLYQGTAALQKTGSARLSSACLNKPQCYNKHVTTMLMHVCMEILLLQVASYHEDPLVAPYLQHVGVCGVITVQRRCSQLLHEGHDGLRVLPEPLPANCHAHQAHTLQGLGPQQPEAPAQHEARHEAGHEPTAGLKGITINWWKL
jgi:hypothetical protein